MLLNVHIKNIALIEDANINFTDGLNILTGETGAGKSIICLLYTSDAADEL